MYQCSDEFHEAVKNNNDQKALLLFSDCVFTDDDIDVTSGLEFNEYFNTEEDIAIGQANSSELNFTLFNDERLLNSYAFGEFTALLGVQLGSKTYKQVGLCSVSTKYATYVGNDTYPFFTRNGQALDSQPSFLVRSIAAYDGRVYAFSDDGRYVVYNDSNGANISGSYRLNSFMTNKSRKWEGKGIWYNKDTRILFIYEAGVQDRYEFVPLGVFNAERPNQPDKIQISLTCYDRMQEFDIDMPSADDLGLTYPVTIRELLYAMCEYVGVPYKEDDFINCNASISEEPDDFSNATMRDVIKWIAEAGGSNARFDRDGVFELYWVSDTDQSYDASDYSDFNPYWYETKSVTKLYNRDTSESEDNTVGSGDEGYLIQDNPLLKGVS